MNSRKSQYGEGFSLRESSHHHRHHAVSEDLSPREFIRMYPELPVNKVVNSSVTSLTERSRASLWPKPWDHWPTCHTSGSHRRTLERRSVECGFSASRRLQPPGSSSVTVLPWKAPAVATTVPQHRERSPAHSGCPPSCRWKPDRKPPRSILLSSVVRGIGPETRWRDPGAVSHVNRHLTGQLCSLVCSPGCRINGWVVLSHGDTGSCCRPYRMGYHKVTLSPESMGVGSGSLPVRG